MYYIYYIPNDKVGATNNLVRRVEQQQAPDNYIVLAKTDNIDEASDLEIYWQDILGFKRDKVPYNKLINNYKIMKNKNENYYVTEKSITFKGTSDKEMSGYKFPKQITLISGETIELTEDLKRFIIHNNRSSHVDFSEERYVYTKAFVLEANNLKTMDNSVFDNIRDWAQVRGIYDKGDSKTQFLKLQEESGELARAILKRDTEETIDAIGDMVVVLTNLAHLEGLSIEKCIESAYDVISSRKGSMINGTFVKES